MSDHYDHTDDEGTPCYGDLEDDAPPSDAYPEGLLRCTDCGALMDDRDGTVIAYGSPYTGGA